MNNDGPKFLSEIDPDDPGPHLELNKIFDLGSAKPIIKLTFEEAMDYTLWKYGDLLEELAKDD